MRVPACRLALGGALIAALASATAVAATLPELIVEAPPELRAEAVAVREIDPRRLEVAARLTGLRGAQPPIHIALVPEGSPPANSVPAWVSGYAYGSLGRVVLLPERTPSYPDGSLEELLLHELTHVFVARAAGGRPVPRWFNEGLAMMAGGPWSLEDRTRLAVAMVRQTERPLAEIDELFDGDPGEVRRAYALAGALVRDIVLQHGRPAPRQILAAIARGESFPDAFRGATGASLAGAAGSFWQRYSFWYRWLPLLGSSFTLWLLIVAAGGDRVVEEAAQGGGAAASLGGRGGGRSASRAAGSCPLKGDGIRLAPAASPTLPGTLRACRFPGEDCADHERRDTTHRGEHRRRRRARAQRGDPGDHAVGAPPRAGR